MQMSPFCLEKTRAAVVSFHAQFVKTPVMVTRASLNSESCSLASGQSWLRRAFKMCDTIHVDTKRIDFGYTIFFIWKNTNPAMNFVRTIVDNSVHAQTVDAFTALFLWD